VRQDALAWLCVGRVGWWLSVTAQQDGHTCC
jgi:hypothetical protein